MATRISYQFNNLLGTVYRQGNLLFSKDGNMLYAAVGNRVSGFDLVRSKCFTFPFEARRNISRIALSPDGAILLALDDEGHLLMANVVRRVVVHHLNLKHSVSDVKFSPDGKWVAFAVGRLVQVWATPTLERSFTPFALHKTLGGHADDITCLAWSADSLFIASGGKDMSVRVHSVHRLPGYAPPTLTGHRSTIRAVYFDAEGETIYAVTRVRTSAAAPRLTPTPHPRQTVVRMSLSYLSGRTPLAPMPLAPSTHPLALSHTPDPRGCPPVLPPPPPSTGLGSLGVGAHAAPRCRHRRGEAVPGGGCR